MFRQPDFPEAGVQVLVGSVNPGEPAEDAVMREAFEETGLTDLRPGSNLGDVHHDRTPRGWTEIHKRRYFHLIAGEHVPETWRHVEHCPSEGEHERALFNLYWVDLPGGISKLVADMGEKIPNLLSELG